jgi:hypothetical protein
LERVTLAFALEIVTGRTPLIIVVLAPTPITFNLMPMVRLSVYAAAATTILSPEAASDMACPMVLQAVVDDKQLLLSPPFNPFTYHVVAIAAGLSEIRRTLKPTRRL